MPRNRQNPSDAVLAELAKGYSLQDLMELFGIDEGEAQYMLDLANDPKFNEE